MTIEVEERARIFRFVELGTIGEGMANVAEGMISSGDGAGVLGEAGAAVRLEVVDKLEGK